MADRAALIVSHGQPSEPAPAEVALATLAGRVAAHLPGWVVRSATLATPGALEGALAGLGHVLVYPLFMTDGWFTQVHVPERISTAGRGVTAVSLPPFGLDREVQALAVTLALEAAREAGRGPEETEVLLAAHGSLRSDAPAALARVVAGRLTREGGFRRVVTGFIDQEPQITTVAAGLGQGALCLPFFAARGGHVEADLPAALAAGGFTGRLLDPVGVDARVPGLIAGALRAAV